MVGHDKTTGVLLKPDFWNLYQCRHTIDLKHGRQTFLFLCDPQVAEDEKLIRNCMFNKFYYYGGGVVVV